MDTKDAFLLITCDVGKRSAVKERLERLDDVKEVTITNGVYDLVAKVESNSKDQFKHMIDKIRYIENVRATLTLLKNANIHDLVS